MCIDIYVNECTNVYVGVHVSAYNRVQRESWVACPPLSVSYPFEAGSLPELGGHVSLSQTVSQQAPVIFSL